MLCQMVQMIGRGILVDLVDRSVIVIRMRTGRVRETLVFIVDCLDWRICDFTKVLMFRKVYIDAAEVRDGDLNKHGPGILP